VVACLRGGLSTGWLVCGLARRLGCGAAYRRGGLSVGRACLRGGGLSCGAAACRRTRSSPHLVRRARAAAAHVAQMFRLICLCATRLGSRLSAMTRCTWRRLQPNAAEKPLESVGGDSQAAILKCTLCIATRYTLERGRHTISCSALLSSKRQARRTNNRAKRT
jgi:hypothetical protein